MSKGKRRGGRRTPAPGAKPPGLSEEAASVPESASTEGEEEAPAQEPETEAAKLEPTPEPAAEPPAPEPPSPSPPPPPQYADPEAATMPAPEDITMSTYALAAANAAARTSGSMPAVAPPAEAPPALDPAAAALEAARIAEKFVGNLDSASGAAIVAAAAAGAAIEAVRARGRVPVDEPGSAGRGSAAEWQRGVVDGEAPPTDDLASGDPVATVRMQRDRILRALAEDVAANAGAAAVAAEPASGDARTGSAAPRRTSGQLRAVTHPGVEDDPNDDERDPVQIAAAAIQRLRARASTDFAELRTHYHRHDVAVLLIAFVMMVIAGRVHQSLVTPPTKTFSVRGLTFEHSQAWLEAEPLPPPPPRIMRDPTGQLPKADSVYNVALTSALGTNARIEVLIDKKPAWSNIVTGLELDRRTRWGELYTLDNSTTESIQEHDWLRTAYRYAHAAMKGDVPRVDHAIEYATIDRDQIYVVTLFGAPAELERIESVVAPTLRVPGRNALPLVAQTRSFGQRSHPNSVARAFDSTVMVVVADMIDGRLRARGGGSGVIVGGDGSILTNYHVIHDKDGRLHDVFIIGRFSALDQAPQLQCAGRPNRSKLQRELDLALIKCDTDLDGRTWVPSTSGVWPTLPEAQSGDVKMGQRLWVLGYPDAGGGGLTLSQGEVEGWTGQDGATGRDFIKTDASITHGNSGGPVVDDRGHLVGIASAYRTRISLGGNNVVETNQVGMIRPLSSASDLLAIAAAGWTPREGHTDVELQPSAVEAPAEGVRIATRVLDVANDAPIAYALVMVLKQGITASTIDVNRLDDQVIAWGRSNAQGEVQLKQPVPVPGTYSVFVKATGYEPLIGKDELRLDAKTPPRFDPWGVIHLRSR